MHHSYLTHFMLLVSFYAPSKQKKMDQSLFYFHVTIYNPVKQNGAIDVSKVSSNFHF